ncbi:hypothetical protein PAMP_002142 [Pampus punctatissimus]
MHQKEIKISNQPTPDKHMAVTCCQGSLSPGLASPALGQMAAHWALKILGLLRPLTLALPRCLAASFPAAPRHTPRSLCLQVD